LLDGGITATGLVVGMLIGEGAGFVTGIMVGEVTGFGAGF